MAGDERLETAAVQMQQVVPQIADGTVKDDVLVDLAVVVAPEPVPKQPQVPARIPTRVANPRPEKDEATIEKVPVAGRRSQHRLDFGAQLGRHALVGIHDEHPLVGNGRVSSAQFFWRE